MSNTYTDANGNTITTTVSDSSGPLITDGSGYLPVNVDTNGYLNTKDPKTEAINIILNSLLKDVLFEITYEDGSKKVGTYDDAMKALLIIGNVTLKAIPNTDAAKLLYGKKE